MFALCVSQHVPFPPGNVQPCKFYPGNTVSQPALGASRADSSEHGLITRSTRGKQCLLICSPAYMPHPDASIQIKAALPAHWVLHAAEQEQVLPVRAFTPDISKGEGPPLATPTDTTLDLNGLDSAPNISNKASVPAPVDTASLGYINQKGGGVNANLQRPQAQRQFACKVKTVPLALGNTLEHAGCPERQEGRTFRYQTQHVGGLHRAYVVQVVTSRPGLIAVDTCTSQGLPVAGWRG
mmetsp:Transcript_37716/g.94517  ORF Transcript_37716/g.94517 Transcript_37716/m.94517 type:complete len:239 (-) Transcript_37716:1300-2016(-)